MSKGLCVGLALLLSAQAGLSAAALTVTAEALTPSAKTLSPTANVMGPLPARPLPIQRIANRPVDDFFAVTLISLPFTAFWALVGALAVGGIAQQRFPPEFDNNLLAGAGAFAGGASLLTGLVSVSWSSSPKATPGPTPTPIPTPAP